VLPVLHPAQHARIGHNMGVFLAHFVNDRMKVLSRHLLDVPRADLAAALKDRNHGRLVRDRAEPTLARAGPA